MAYKSFKRLWDHSVNNLQCRHLLPYAVSSYTISDWNLKNLKNWNYSILEACTKCILVGIKAQWD